MYLLDIVQELRNAGAEVIQVGGVRVVASTFFDDEGTTVYADNAPVERPLTILAIGDSATLSAAMSIPGGVVDSVSQRATPSNTTVRSSPTRC